MKNCVNRQGVDASSEVKFEMKVLTQAIGLEHVQHFADVIFEFFVMLDEVTSPFRRIPNLKFVIHPN